MVLKCGSVVAFHYHRELLSVLTRHRRRNSFYRKTVADKRANFTIYAFLLVLLICAQSAFTGKAMFMKTNRGNSHTQIHLNDEVQLFTVGF